MKNLLIIGGIGLALYFAFGKKKDENTDKEAVWQDTFFEKYNNRIAYDREGRWFLVKDGKILPPISQETINAYVKQYPQFAEILFIDESVWDYFALNDQTVFNPKGF